MIYNNKEFDFENLRVRFIYIYKKLGMWHTFENINQLINGFSYTINDRKYLQNAYKKYLIDKALKEKLKE